MNEEQQLLTSQYKKKSRKTFKYSYIIVILAILLLGSMLLTVLIYNNNVSLKSPVRFRGQASKGSKGAVAVESKECSDVGVNVLKKGGNAVDSAIASTLCIGVINGFATGIGGGGFMLIRSPNGTFEFIDFRETAPLAASKDMFVKDPVLSRIGGLSVAIPGEIRGLELAHQRHGKLPWSTLFEKPIHLAKHGFETTEFLTTRIKLAQVWMSNLEDWTDIYFKDGKPSQKGDVIKRPKLAQTLEKIAKYGADIFYNGQIAKSLVEKIQSTGGIATLDDFNNYKPVIRPTISTYYNGRKVTTCSEPTSGRVLLSMLNLVERFQFKTDGMTGLNVHRLIEVFKFGFSFKTELGDPDFIYNLDRKNEISTKDFASFTRRKITDNETHDTLYYKPKFEHSESHGTMHLSVVDKDNGAVALTSTVNLPFGSHVLDEQTGIILNNQMNDFSTPKSSNNTGLPPNEYNYIEPLKRPMSSTTPTIIEVDSAFEMALGGSGGSWIPTITLNTIVNILEHGKDLYSAISSPRIHHQLLPDKVVTENGYNKKIKNDLKKRRHSIFDLPEELCTTGVQAVKRNSDGTVEAVSDPRKMGIASAY